MKELNNAMNLQMFGGWDEVLRDPQSNTGKTEFTKLTNGVTELRFLDDEPFVRWAHWIAQAKRNVSCIGADCPICSAIKASKQAGIKPQYSSNRRFAMHVLNLSTGNVEILEQGKTFFTQLHALHEEIGDIRGYNIKVKTQNAGSTDVTYTLLPCAPSELSDEQKELCSELKPFDEIFKKPTKEQVLGLMSGKSPEEVFSNKSSEEDEEIGL
jgi:hypothetical protein|nr:MAG TPA_asm: DNA binding protein [Caudoviricetes sp.]